MELLRGDGRVLRIGHRGVEGGADVIELDVIGGPLVAHSRAETGGAPSLDDELVRLAALGLAVQIDVKEPGLADGVAAALVRRGFEQRSFGGRSRSAIGSESPHRLDRERVRARNVPGGKRYRRYHHRRSASRSPGTIDNVKRFAPLLLALLAAGAFAATVLADTTPPPTTTGTTTTAPTPSTVPLGVTLAGVQIGGLAPDAATQAVTAAFSQPVTLRFGATRIAVAPSLLGLTVPVDSAVAKALTVAPNTQLTLRGTVDSSLVHAFVAKIGARFARKPVESKLVLRNLKPFVTPPVTGQTIEVNVGVRDLMNELVHGTRATIILKARYKQPSVTPSTIGPVIVIRRGDNQLTLYNGMKVVRTFEVATGQAVYPTPLGKFSIVVMWRNPWWYPPNSPWAAGEKPIPPGPGNPLGTRWMGLSAPGVGIHGTPEDGSIGYSLSHGCIRMHIPQAEWLFNHVTVGTPVYIVAA